MQHIERYLQTFIALQPDGLGALDSIFAPDARFKDPFNDVRGIMAIRSVFAHMYAHTHGSHFVVREWAVQGQTLFVLWDYHFQTRQGGKPWRIEGTSVVRFNAEGLAIEHIDYWDVAEQLYAKVPVLGWLMQWLRGRLQASG